MKKNLLKSIVLGCLSLLIFCCTSQNNQDENKEASKTVDTKAPYVKKYTNKDFYKDNKLQKDVVLKAYEEMLAHYDVELSDFMRKNLWITDFELGDFENVGMAGFFWVNDAENNYFAHEIYLLPGQMITEHRHERTKFSPKMESWVVKQGWIYNYSMGEETPNGPKLPDCQKGYITAKNYMIQKPDEITHLNKLEDSHFMMAGPDGAIVYEFASYHDMDGLKFTNPKAVFTDILTQD